MNRPIHIVVNSLRASLAVHEKRYIQDSLAMYKGNKRRTAKALAIGLSTLYRKLELYEISYVDATKP